ncbi:MAG TPA: D-alanyl-D-alanine carboxypeptidase family protein [Sphingobacteriaceae bacterium]|nr:D-alanyl-D-alanine carboxypeptidase family protein [Sphingobacteriaceae bacterium]
MALPWSRCLAAVVTAILLIFPGVLAPGPLAALAQEVPPDQADGSDMVPAGPPWTPEFPTGLPTAPGSDRDELAFPAPDAQAFILLEGATGQILAQGNADAPLPMASTTKLLTGLLLAEATEPDDLLWVPFEARGIEGSKLFMEPGERYTARELLIALMVASANDAAVTVAVNLDGGVEAFARRMNAKAAALGMTGSNFANPHGLDDENHYASARDLARLAVAAMANRQVREAAGLTNAVISDPIRQSTRELNSHNLFVVTYPHVVGAKTGFTSRAGFCLVAVAEKDGRQVVGVILGGSRGDRVARDMAAMMDWAFAAFEPVTVVPQGTFFEDPGAGDEGSRGWVAGAPVTAAVPRGSHGAPSISTRVETGARAGQAPAGGDVDAGGDGPAALLVVEGEGGLQVTVPLNPAGGSTAADATGLRTGGGPAVLVNNPQARWSMGIGILLAGLYLFRRRRRRRRRYTWTGGRSRRAGVP